MLPRSILTFNPHQLPMILESVEKAHGSLGQVADLNYIPRSSFYIWLREGDEDRKNNKNTELANFSSELRKRQSEIICELIELALSNFQRARFIIWLLGKISKEDFGDENEELLQLKDFVFNRILPLIGKDANHGKGQEVHTESNKTSGCIA